MTVLEATLGWRMKAYLLGDGLCWSFHALHVCATHACLTLSCTPRPLLHTYRCDSPASGEGRMRVVRAMTFSSCARPRP